MTAEIGILNKTSIVLAADSAVTVGSDRVYQNANKLFDIGIDNSIGIMIYNHASWMGIPLEIIINGFSKHINAKKYSELKDVTEDLINYMKSNYAKFISEESANEFIKHRLHEMLDALAENCNDLLKESKINETEKSQETLELIFYEILEDACKFNGNNKKMIDFEDYTLKEFKRDFKEVINKVLPGFYSTYKIPRKAKYTSRIYKTLYHEIIYSIDSKEEDFSGIVIAGYGEDEIFPTIIDIKIAELFQGRLRYNPPEHDSVDNRKTAIVSPFAQSDMIHTFFQGIDPELIHVLKSTVNDELKLLQKKIVTKFNLQNSDVHSFFSTTFNNIGKKFAVERERIHTEPIIETIQFMRNEDIIEIAESLINLTSLKRKASNKIQSVGGPIDIAIITKSNGFCWVKRKDFVTKLYS